MNNEFRSGYVAIIGEPNVGKSTLLNSILKQKISIVTPKPQTTRNKILGITSGKDSQIIFVDTPGLIKPRYLLHNVMMHYASTAAKDADIILFVVDAEEIGKSSENKLFQNISPNKIQKLFLVINKIDKITKEQLLVLINKLQDVFKWDEIVPISALKNNNINELKNTILKYLPIHAPYYDEEQLTDKSEKFFVSEIVRENIFKIYKNEVPYSTTVLVTEFKERKKGKFYISAEIFVERDSQRAILIGNKGEKLKYLGSKSRTEIEKFLEHEIYLELFVKVREAWRDKKNWLNNLGYSEY